MNTNKINLAIIGCGFIGGALKQWLENNNDNVNILVSDPYKGMNDDLSKADIAFISIHILTESDGTQDLTVLEDIIDKLPDIPIFIRTTILPGTSEMLSKKLNKEIYFLPEFLRERTAYPDFCNQPMIFTGHFDLLEKIFINKRFITMSSLEAEITKYAHNVFGALKVTYFNGIYDVCKNLNIEYEKVKQGVLLSGNIIESHSSVPGHDSKMGYGGKCFPKDVNAFIEFTDGMHINKLLTEVKRLNEIFRKD